MVSDRRWTEDRVKGEGRRVSQLTNNPHPVQSRKMGLTFTLHEGPSVCKDLGHELVQAACRFCMVGVLGEALEHGSQHLIQRGSCFIQNDGGLCQEAIQVPVCTDLFLKVL
jgi:hypothetical protein